MSLGSYDETKLESIEGMKLMWEIKRENKVINLLACFKRHFVISFTLVDEKYSRRRVSRQPKIGLLPGTISTALKLKFYHNQTNLAERERPRRGLIFVFLWSNVKKTCHPPPPFFIWMQKPNWTLSSLRSAAWLLGNKTKRHLTAQKPSRVAHLAAEENDCFISAGGEVAFVEMPPHNPSFSFAALRRAGINRRRVAASTELN